jgi:asparagine synthase (glutamine-hydrolysing)
VVVALARTHLPQATLKTFIGAFPDGPAYDERPWAREMARHAHTEPFEIVLGQADFVASIEKIVWHMDEPAAGPGVFPQHAVSAMAARHVKVVLGGQGGDELFIGYARYLIAYLEECIKGAIEETADRGHYVATLSTIVPSLPTLQNYIPMLRSFWQRGLFEPAGHRYLQLIDRLGEVVSVLSPDVAIDSDATLAEFSKIFDHPCAASMINRILYFDVKTHLQALLQVEDRTSMAFGLESRVPLLDHRLVEFMARVPPAVKFRDGRLKHLFLAAVRGLVPEAIASRKDKMGFPVPISSWFRGPLRELLHDTLGSARARTRGIWDTDGLLTRLDREPAFGRVAWGALSLELWFRRFIDAQ